MILGFLEQRLAWQVENFTSCAWNQNRNII